MIPVPDEVVREVVRDLREYHGYLRHDNGVGAPRAQENAELLEDLLEGDRPDLDGLARQHCSAEGIEIHASTDDIDRVEYPMLYASKPKQEGLNE